MASLSLTPALAPCRASSSALACPSFVASPPALSLRVRHSARPAAARAESNDEERPDFARVDEKDPWEGEQFEALGQLLYWFIPIVAAIAVVVGGFASQTYNDGADNFLQAATSDEAPALIVPAEAVLKEIQ